MDDSTHLSFYLYSDTMRVFKNAIRTLENPPYVRFRIHADGGSMILEPYEKKCFTSFKVPKNLYDEKGSMRIYSKALCRLLAEHLKWNTGKSYRIPGKIMQDQKIVYYDLTKAVEIERFENKPLISE